MSKVSALRKAQKDGKFAEFKRKPRTYYPVAGYLIEQSKQCLVVKELNWDTFAWNGTCLIRTQDVADVHVFGELEWPMIAARSLGLAASTAFSIGEGGLHDVAQRYLHPGDLAQIEKEGTDPGEMFLCVILEMCPDGLWARSYDRTLRSFDETRMPYRDITKVTFGDAYSKAAAIALRRLKRDQRGSR
jgi:hypothetical protein